MMALYLASAAMTGAIIPLMLLRQARAEIAGRTMMELLLLEALGEQTKLVVQIRKQQANGLELAA